MLVLVKALWTDFNPILFNLTTFSSVDHEEFMDLENIFLIQNLNTVNLDEIVVDFARMWLYDKLSCHKAVLFANMTKATLLQFCWISCHGIYTAQASLSFCLVVFQTEF